MSEWDPREGRDASARALRSGERLQTYLARSGVASRRAAERLIVEGRVRVNEELVDTPGTSVVAGRDRVEVDGCEVVPREALRYVVLHKPRGVVSTASDPRARPTVVELIRAEERLYPVGRLDWDSEGLLILTNDGDLAFRLTHPRHAVEKEYRVLVSGEVSEQALSRLRAGVPLDGSPTSPAEVVITAREGESSWLRIVLHEGRNRQIRRMVEQVGLRVARLIRTRVGSLQLGSLGPGEWRDLRPSEVARLRGSAA